MGLALLTKSVFWVWYALQPMPAPMPEVQVVPTKQILQATWIEPAALRDKTSPPALRYPAVKRKSSLLTSNSSPKLQKPHKPLWNAAKTWEIPPILWAGFQGFLVAGLGILSLLKP